MNVNGFLKVKLPMYSKSRNYCLGKGATMYVQDICDALALYLVQQYEYHEQNGKSCLIGDIGSLYKRKEEIDKKRYGEMTYREHLQEQIRKDLYSSPKGKE